MANQRSMSSCRPRLPTRRERANQLCRMCLSVVNRVRDMRSCSCATKSRRFSQPVVLSLRAGSKRGRSVTAARPILDPRRASAPSRWRSRAQKRRRARVRHRGRTSSHRTEQRRSVRSVRRRGSTLDIRCAHFWCAAGLSSSSDPARPRPGAQSPKRNEADRASRGAIRFDGRAADRTRCTSATRPRPTDSPRGLTLRSSRNVRARPLALDQPT